MGAGCGGACCSATASGWWDAWAQAVQGVICIVKGEDMWEIA